MEKKSCVLVDNSILLFKKQLVAKSPNSVSFSNTCCGQNNLGSLFNMQVPGSTPNLLSKNLLGWNLKSTFLIRIPGDSYSYCILRTIRNESIIEKRRKWRVDHKWSSSWSLGLQPTHKLYTHIHKYCFISLYLCKCF